MTPHIIIGAGLAGYSVAREFRKLDKTTPLLLVTADGGGFYSKPMLSNAFAQDKRAEQLVTQSAAQMAAQLNAHIVTETRVQAIDKVRKTVATDSGIFAYDKLVLAVGAQPIRLKIDGDAGAEVLSVNHVADYAAFRSRIVPGAMSRIAILGAGLIGCEFADDLAGAGHAVTLIDPNPLPLAALAAPPLSRGLQAALVARGVALRLGTTATRISHGADALQVELADGRMFETDIVLSAVGLRPDLTLANAAQLATARGILVDTFGRTSAQDIYALGDCAEYTSNTDGSTRILPYIAPLMSAARAIARTLSGQATAIDLDSKATPIIVKTPSYPLALVPPPAHATDAGTWHAQMDNARTICRFYDAAGVMQGFGVAPQDASVRQGLLAALGTMATEQFQAT